MEADPTEAYKPDDTTGFIRLNALRLKVAATVRGEEVIPSDCRQKKADGVPNLCMQPPTSQDAARRLLILLVVKSLALRLMMRWDFIFRTRHTLKKSFGIEPEWKSLGFGGWWLRQRAKWNWRTECSAWHRALQEAGAAAGLTTNEFTFLRCRLSAESRESANQMLWQIEGAACIAWALRLMPRIWPMDEQFDGKLDEKTLLSPKQQLVVSAALRPREEIEAARKRVELWHWRARQHTIERQGVRWPPPDACPDVIADLKAKGLDSLDGVVRFTAVSLKRNGVLHEIIGDDFPARGRAYRELSDSDAFELLSIAQERHRALNWLCGMATENDWDVTPTET